MAFLLGDEAVPGVSPSGPANIQSTAVLSYTCATVNGDAL